MMAGSGSSELRRLFEACDRHNRGSIGRQEFRELCASFDIAHQDSDVIFADLDRDQDQRISFEDFSCGFRDFLVPSPAGAEAEAPPSWTADSNATSSDSIPSSGGRRRALRRQSVAWKQLSQRFGEDQIRRALTNRSCSLNNSAKN